jgi:hypothetical protein
MVTAVMTVPTSVIATAIAGATTISGRRFATTIDRRSFAASWCRFAADRPVTTVMPMSATAPTEQPGVGLRFQNHQDGEHRRQDQHHSNEISLHQ